MSKAFDRVWHEGIIHKLKKAGIAGKLLEWLKDYLKERKQRVIINGQSSEESTITAGVPQGSILGPQMFIIYMNDLITELTTEARLYADDVCIFEAVENRERAKVKMNENLEIINMWATL